MNHYTSFDEDFFTETNSNSEDVWMYEPIPVQDTSTFYAKNKKPLREKNSARKNSAYNHVFHRDKPFQVVEKRNARERRRVQAVNNAFVMLRNAVPIQNTRGKRISKVKTLVYAMEYIRALDKILNDCGNDTNCYEMTIHQQSKNTEFDPCDPWNYEEETIQAY